MTPGQEVISWTERAKEKPTSNDIKIKMLINYLRYKINKVINGDTKRYKDRI